MSTGMATTGEIREAIPPSVADLTLLHCVSSYPCPISEVNLHAITTLGDLFGCRVGYSDHTTGTVACLAAAAVGARVIEKHFMLEEHSVCVDKPVSICTADLIKMVSDIRAIEKALGDGIKIPTISELPNRARFRKGMDGRRGAV